jgi:hypothetical protein
MKEMGTNNVDIAKNKLISKKCKSSAKMQEMSKKMRKSQTIKKCSKVCKILFWYLARAPEQLQAPSYKHQHPQGPGARNVKIFL